MDDKAMVANASRDVARACVIYAFPVTIADAEIRNVVNNYYATNLMTLGAVQHKRQRLHGRSRPSAMRSQSR